MLFRSVQRFMLKSNYALLCVFLMTTTTTTLSAAPINLTKLETPQAAPHFELIDLDNNVNTLGDYKGKPLIVNFWATWCPPLAINVGEDPNTVYDFIRDYPIDFKVLLDLESDELANWQMRGLPTTYILNYKGEVVYQAIGEREWDNDELLTKVLALRKP